MNTPVSYALMFVCSLITDLNIGNSCETVSDPVREYQVKKGATTIIYSQPTLKDDVITFKIEVTDPKAKEKEDFLVGLETITVFFYDKKRQPIKCVCVGMLVRDGIVSYPEVVRECLSYTPESTELDAKKSRMTYSFTINNPCRETPHSVSVYPCSSHFLKPGLLSYPFVEHMEIRNGKATK